MRVLVVDDSKISRQLIVSHLKDFGIEDIEVAEDGLEALSKIKKLPLDTKFDMITLDVVMPRKDGLAVLKEIKVLSPKSKILMCSSNNDAHTVAIAIGFGIDGYVIKPFTKQKFLEAIWQTIKKDLDLVGMSTPSE